MSFRSARLMLKNAQARRSRKANTRAKRCLARLWLAAVLVAHQSVPYEYFILRSIRFAVHRLHSAKRAENIVCLQTSASVQPRTNPPKIDKLQFQLFADFGNILLRKYICFKLSMRKCIFVVIRENVFLPVFPLIFSAFMRLLLLASKKCRGTLKKRTSTFSSTKAGSRINGSSPRMRMNQ